MGLHQDKDEEDFAAPVVSFSLGDTGVFRIGGTSRKGSDGLAAARSGDAVVFGGKAGSPSTVSTASRRHLDAAA